MTSIEIPFANDEVIEIDLNELQGSEEDIMAALAEAKAHLKFFLQFAVSRTD
jgi:hypothetical protein